MSDTLLRPNIKTLKKHGEVKICMGKYKHDIVTVNVFYYEKRGTVHSDPLSNELPSERK